MRKLAERLVAHETRKGKSLETKTPANFIAIEKLRPQLTTLMGNAGFGALLMRARALACTEVSWLRELQIKADGSLDGFDGIKARVKAKELFTGKVVLLTQLLGLLHAFIGEILTLRLVIEVWPGLSLDDMDFGGGDNNEKQK